jgi:hypothetical protein
MLDGYGAGADSVKLCLSRRVSFFGSEVVFECAVKFNGANTVKYGFARADNSRANGFVGVGESCIDGANFVEKGKRVDNKDDIDASAAGRFAFLLARSPATSIELVPNQPAG